MCQMLINFVNMTMSDTGGAIGTDLSKGAETFSRRLQFPFSMPFMFWKKQENKVSNMVGVFLAFLFSLLFFPASW